MKTIVLISCVSKKLAHKSPAKDLYDSPLFKGNLYYASSFKPDNIFVLSAKYGLVPLDREIEPYNLTLNNMAVSDIKKWAVGVLSQLHEVVDLDNDRIIFLAGEKYRRFLITSVKHYEVPMQGKTIGKQLRFLKEQRSHD